ncbi:MAG: class IV adenylate cyclase [Planctomycetota bacterium]
MAQNIEIKARLTQEQFDLIDEKGRELTESWPEVLRQKDTFFESKSGRLKLREFFDQDGNPTSIAELIHYHRPDQDGPKLSKYSRIEIEQASELREALAGANGVISVVEKCRQLYLLEQTRVHLDDVKSLGLFLELEVVLEQGQTTDDGTQIARHWMEEFGVTDEMLVDRAYIDLLPEPLGR